MPNQTTYMLSLDDSPIQSINANFDIMADNLAMVNIGLANLANALTLQIPPVFKTIEDSLITSKKNIESLNSFSQSGLNSAISRFNTTQSSLKQVHDSTNNSNSSPDNLHSLFQKAHSITGVANSSSNLYDLVKNKGILQEGSELQSGLTLTDDATGILDSIPGFIEEKLFWGIFSDLVDPWISIPAQLIIGMAQIYEEFSGAHKSYPSALLLDPQNAFKNVKPLHLPTGTYIGDDLLPHNKDGSLYEKPMPSFPTLNPAEQNALFNPNSKNAFSAISTANNYEVPSIIKQVATYGATHKATAENSLSQPALGYNYINPWGPEKSITIGGTIPTIPHYSSDSNGITINNHYNNLIGQLTITNSKLDMDLMQVKELVSEAIVQSLMNATKDSHIGSSK